MVKMPVPVANGGLEFKAFYSTAINENAYISSHRWARLGFLGTI
jgi:hypothetical protein